MPPARPWKAGHHGTMRWGMNNVATASFEPVGKRSGWQPAEPVQQLPGPRPIMNSAAGLVAFGLGEFDEIPHLPLLLRNGIEHPEIRWLSGQLHVERQVQEAVVRDPIFARPHTTGRRDMPLDDQGHFAEPHFALQHRADKLARVRNSA